MVAPSKRISSTNNTTPIGPFDFFIGGAALATLFLGTGALDAGLLGGPLDAGLFAGPLDAGPPGEDFLGANGDWVTLDAPIFPFAGALEGAPPPTV